MQTTLAATALFMGLAGGPHCVAMCGAACAGIGRAGDGRNTRSMWTFQAGRVVGYSLMGGVAATSMQGPKSMTPEHATNGRFAGPAGS